MITHLKAWKCKNEKKVFFELVYSNYLQSLNPLFSYVNFPFCKFTLGRKKSQKASAEPRIGKPKWFKN